MERGYIIPTQKEKAAIAEELGVQVEQIDW